MTQAKLNKVALHDQNLPTRKAKAVKGGWWFAGYSQAAALQSQVQKSDHDAKAAIIQKIG